MREYLLLAATSVVHLAALFGITSIYGRYFIAWFLIVLSSYVGVVQCFFPN